MPLIIHLNKKHFDSRVLQDKLLCIAKVSLWKCPCHRSSILKSISKLLVQVGYLFNMLSEKFCSFIKNILIIFTR